MGFSPHDAAAAIPMGGGRTFAAAAGVNEGFSPHGAVAAAAGVTHPFFEAREAEAEEATREGEVEADSGEGVQVTLYKPSHTTVWPRPFAMWPEAPLGSIATGSDVTFLQQEVKVIEHLRLS